MIRTYSELITIPSFKDRFLYLKLDGRVGEDTFGWDRYLNQKFYHSKEWLDLRDFIIIRDNGCDLAIEGYEISGKIIIHHLNPIDKSDVFDLTDYLMNPEYLITTSIYTHNAIHYGDVSLLVAEPIIRSYGDTKLW